MRITTRKRSTTKGDADTGIVIVKTGIEMQIRMTRDEKEEGDIIMKMRQRRRGTSVVDVDAKERRQGREEMTENAVQNVMVTETDAERGAETTIAS